MVRTALLVADMEGVAGVDRAEDLAFGGRGHSEACARMTEEVVVAGRALQAAGWGRVRVSDSHRSGSDRPNVDAAALPPGVELAWTEDAYAPALFEDVGAVACLGMHAAGVAPGFGAHTVSVHASLRAGFRPLSETDVVLGLAAELGVGVLFASGDDVLGRALAGRVPYVETKRALSVTRARSAPAAAVRRALAAAARRAPASAGAPPAGPLCVEFKDPAPAAWLRPGPTLVVRGRTARVRAESFGARYRLALRAVDDSAAALVPDLDGPPGTEAFARSVAALLGRRF